MNLMNKLVSFRDEQIKEITLIFNNRDIMIKLNIEKKMQLIRHLFDLGLQEFKQRNLNAGKDKK